MKVIGAGFPKTGTKSFWHAMEILGYNHLGIWLIFHSVDAAVTELSRSLSRILLWNFNVKSHLIGSIICWMISLISWVVRLILKQFVKRLKAWEQNHVQVFFSKFSHLKSCRLVFTKQVYWLCYRIKIFLKANIDFPFNLYWEEFYNKYPDSKVILTIRDSGTRCIIQPIIKT